MSAKGCSPDNAACEGFFGRLKNEFFHHRDWSGVGSDAFMVELDVHGVLLRGADQGVPGLDEPERVPQEPGLRLVIGPGNCPHPQQFFSLC